MAVPNNQQLNDVEIANALEYDYLYRQAYYEKHGKYPTSLSPLGSLAKCSGEMLMNLGSTMITGVYSSFVNEDGSFNVSGSQEFVGMMIGSAITVAYGNINIEISTKSTQNKSPDFELEKDLVNAESAKRKLGEKEKIKIDLEKDELVTVKNKTVVIESLEFAENFEKFRLDVTKDTKYKKCNAWWDATNHKKYGYSASGNYYKNEYILSEKLKPYAEPVLKEKFPNLKTTSDYTAYHEYTLSKEFIDSIPNEYFTSTGCSKASVNIEMAKLRNAIQRTKNEAIISDTGFEFNAHGQPSFKYEWNVENCAEVWSAHQAIMEGVKYENIRFKCVTTQTGEWALPCKNCEKTFAELLNHEGE